jgi:meckelin
LIGGHAIHALQIIKLLKLFVDMITLDIFFIDWERPKSSSDHFLHGSNKSHPGTPSISSSLKPPLSSPSPTNENSVSAWRNYFVANEWQELITKRKVSVQLHVVYVIIVWMVRIQFFFDTSCDNNHFHTTLE